MLVAGLYPNVCRADPPSRPQAPPRLCYLAESGKEEVTLPPLCTMPHARPCHEPPGPRHLRCGLTGEKARLEFGFR